MAGYIINLNSINSLELYIENGVYATKLSAPRNGRWLVHHEGTFADYATVKPGDNIYFFIQRNIYGIGSLVELAGDCKFLNFPNASQPEGVNYGGIQPYLLWEELMKLVLERKIDHGGNPVLRWMMDNIYVKTDPAGNIKPDKEKSTERIDGAVVLIMALDRAVRHQNRGSVYDNRGILVL